MSIYEIKETFKRNLDVYKNSEIIDKLNDYNIVTVNYIKELERKIELEIFKAPYYDKQTVWGYERIFYPFTNKLMKIINADVSNLSIQMHPYKSEQWIPMNSSTTIHDGRKIVKVMKNQIVNVKPRTIHGIRKKSKIFEIQDNMLFDNNETIRIHDYNGRTTAKFNDIYKCLMPQQKGNIKIKEYNTNMNTNLYDMYNGKRNQDIFLFILDGEVIDMKNGIKVNGKDNKNELLFVSNEYVENIKLLGNIIVIGIKYYEINKFEL